MCKECDWKNSLDEALILERCDCGHNHYVRGYQPKASTDELKGASILFRCTKCDGLRYVASGS